MNNSWGGGRVFAGRSPTRSRRQAAGVLFVAAAGNNASNKRARAVLSPGLRAANVGAAATAPPTLAPFNYGPLGHSAPGREQSSLSVRLRTPRSDPSGTSTFSGQSMRAATSSVRRTAFAQTPRAPAVLKVAVFHRHSVRRSRTPGERRGGSTS